MKIWGLRESGKEQLPCVEGRVKPWVASHEGVMQPRPLCPLELPRLAVCPSAGLWEARGLQLSPRLPLPLILEGSLQGWHFLLEAYQQHLLPVGVSLLRPRFCGSGCWAWGGSGLTRRPPAFPAHRKVLSRPRRELSEARQDAEKTFCAPGEAGVGPESRLALPTCVTNWGKR